MNLKKNIFVVYILCSSLSLYSQSVEILKDSIYIDGEYYELQELAITQPVCYSAIQEYLYKYKVVDRIFTNYKERLNYKKKLILDCGNSLECLRDKGCPLEYYFIIYEKNGILNLDMAADYLYVGSTTVNLFNFTFDLKEDKNLGEDVFINKDKLLRIYQKKLKVVFREMEEEFDDNDVERIDLSQYDIVTDTAGNILRFVFIYHFFKSIYWDVSFSFEEIKPFLNPEFLRRLNEE